MDQIAKGPTSNITAPLAPCKVVNGFLKWYEYQITPEISFDSTITGRLVANQHVIDLKKAMFAQQHSIQQVLREHAVMCELCQLANPMQA